MQAGTTAGMSKEVYTMFTLQVKYNGRWKWGIRTYETLEDAKRRIAELAAVGIRSRVRLTAELYQ